MTARSALSLHPIKSFLSQLQVARVANFLARIVDPLFFERVFRWAIGLVKNAEDAGERELREFVSGELVGDVVPELVLGTVVPFLFLDHFEAAALLRVGRIEYVREKFDA